MGKRKLRAELERLYVERYDKFLRVGLAIVGEEAGARDAVQDGFANALRAAARFEGDEVEGWVWRIVVRSALTVRRRQQPIADNFGLEFVADDAGELDAVGVRGWVARLPERQRLAVFLRYYADLDYRSIAEALEIEVGTVSATLSQAHTALRRQLREVER